MEAFEATIEEAPRGGACIEVPGTVVDALGGAGRIAVIATFDGIEYRGSIVTMNGTRVLGMLKSIRSQLGKAPGDRVTVTVAVDETPRTIDVPADVAEALEQAGVRERFDALSYSHRREYVTWIDDAKKPETRRRRISETVTRVSR